MQKVLFESHNDKNQNLTKFIAPFGIFFVATFMIIIFVFENFSYVSLILFIFLFLFSSFFVFMTMFRMNRPCCKLYIEHGTMHYELEGKNSNFIHIDFSFSDISKTRILRGFNGYMLFIWLSEYKLDGEIVDKRKKLCVAYGIDRIECENIIDKMKKAKNDLLWE